MRAWSLAIFLIMLNMSISFLNEYGVFQNTLAPSDSAQPGVFEEIGRKLSEINAGNQNALIQFGLMIIVVLEVFKLFVIIILKSTVLLPFMLGQIGIPGQMIAMYTAITWAIYVAGAVQFITGRSFKQLE